MRIGRWETLGAWLGVWTPPREAEVPPVPWRAVAAGGAVLAIVLAAAAALLIPRIGDDKREAAERERRAAAQRHADLLATADREQRPRHGRGPEGASRLALVADARAAIAADARERTGREIRGTDCEPFPAGRGDQISEPAAVYQCVAVTSRFEQGVIGIPFRLVVRFTEGRYAFCRIVPLGDKDRLSHPLPGACRL